MVTPYGKAVSASDFFIPPSPYAAADVEVTGRMNIGDTHTVSIGTANKIGLIVFDGSAGQNISLNLSSVTIAHTNVYIYNPDGTTLASINVGTGGGFIDATTLPTTGTYTIMVDPTSTYTGSMTLTLYNVVDVTGTITPGGSAVVVTTTVPGQNANLTFSGTAGQKVSLNLTSVTMTNSFVYIYNPDGTTLASSNVGTSGNFYTAPRTEWTNRRVSV